MPAQAPMEAEPPSMDDIVAAAEFDPGKQISPDATTRYDIQVYRLLKRCRYAHRR